MKLNQQDNNYNDIVSITNNKIILSHTTLNIPCFVSKNYHTEVSALTLEQLDKAMLFPLTSQDDVDILIIGTGKNNEFISLQQQVDIQHMKIGVESMNNKAACRCFNLLLSDARSAGILLL